MFILLTHSLKMAPKVPPSLSLALSLARPLSVAVIELKKACFAHPLLSLALLFICRSFRRSILFCGVHNASVCLSASSIHSPIASISSGSSLHCRLSLLELPFAAVCSLFCLAAHREITEFVADYEATVPENVQEFLSCAKYID